MKKLISIALSLLLASNTFALSAFAAETADAPDTAITSEERDYTVAEKAATDLKSLGLFKGVSDTDFDLERAPTRTEAMVMLIRILGKEAEALEGEYTHPFTDVAEWADNYIGYAYENKLTNGISATEFGASDANAAMFLTFVLRALGYSDAEGADFTWDDPFELAEKTGILAEAVDTESFLRADVALVAYNALEANLKDSEQTLSEKLIADGVFTAEQYAAIGLPADVSEFEYSYLTDFTNYTYNDGLDENGFFEGIKASDYVDLGDYKNLDIDASMFAVTQEEIDAEIALLLEDIITYEKITDRAVEDGDMVSIDMAIAVLGQRVEDESMKDIPFAAISEIDEETRAYIEDMMTALMGEYVEFEWDFVIDFVFGMSRDLIGKKIGDVATFTLAFPEGSVIEGAEGMSIDFEITVNYIIGDEIIPELTDEIAKEQGFETKEELIADITEWIAAAKKAEVLNTVVDNAVCETIPDSVLEYFINSDLYTYYEYAEIYEMSVEEFVVEMYGCESLNAMVNDNIEVYKENAKLYLVIQAIAEAEGITVTDEDVAAYGYSDLIDYYGESYIKFILLSDYIVPAYVAELYN